jgi:acyl dehydratase
VTQEHILRFAGACGDFNPLHYDLQVARRAGFDAPIAMGQMTAGIAAAWIADWCGVEQLAELEVRFVAPVLVGDRLTLSGSVTTVEPVDDGQLARLELTGTKGDVVVVTGRASVLDRGTGTTERPGRA